LVRTVTATAIPPLRDGAQELRASNYTIYVDLLDTSDRVLLVHGYSGAYDVVAQPVADYVRRLDTKPPKPLHGTWQDAGSSSAPAAPPSDETIELLKRRGYLTYLTRGEERQRFDRFTTALHERASAAMPTYIFMPTYDCNLRCGYCFQDHMRTDPAYQHLLRHMTPALVERIFDAMPALEARHGAQHGDERPRSVVLFGGEPLLRRSRPIIERIVAMGKQHGPTRFSAVTNGTDLDAYLDLLGPDGIATLQITLDGPRSGHDARRIYADGSGSFDRICANLDAALERGTNVDVRMNVDRSNIATLPELAQVFADRNWAGRPNFYAYVAPVHGTRGDPSAPKTFNSFELRTALRELYEAHPATRAISIADDGLRATIQRVFKTKSSALPIMKAAYCGAHTNMYVFDPFGDVYACWERTGDKNIRIGWLEKDGTLELVADRLAAWRSRNVSSNETCAQCRYSMYCGGGCAVMAEDVHGTMFGNYCDAFGRRLRTTIAEAYRNHVDHVEIDAAVQELRAL
jgi:uncharacterized protein